MKLKITKEIKQKYPNLRIGVVVGRGVKNRESDSNLEQFKRVSEEKLRASDWTSEHLVEHPFIAAWRETYRSFGAKPKEYTPTAESIIKRVLKGNDLPKINASEGQEIQEYNEKPKSRYQIWARGKQKILYNQLVIVLG